MEGGQEHVGVWEKAECGCGSVWECGKRGVGVCGNVSSG